MEKIKYNGLKKYIDDSTNNEAFVNLLKYASKYTVGKFVNKYILYDYAVPYDALFTNKFSFSVMTEFKFSAYNDNYVISICNENRNCENLIPSINNIIKFCYKDNKKVYNIIDYLEKDF